ncbi:MAG: DUF3540 domain-containing protein [Deltaproteobacteria bacterium]|nr:DUF3540 domain-containing protein [Deltaproteobacteria bacterium]
MNHAAETFSTALGTAAVQPARVVAVLPANAGAWVQPARETAPTWALCTVGCQGLVPGQDVLLAEDATGSVYIVGALPCADLEEPRPTLRAPSGARAELSEDGTTLRVLSPGGDLVFEYDPAANRTVCRVPRGDLQLATDDGDIDLCSGRDLRLTAGRAVHVHAESAIELGASPLGSLGALLRLGRDLLHLRGPTVRLEAERADLTATHLSCQGQSATGRFTSARVIAERIETWTGELVSRAREVHQVVEGLWNVKADRLRAVARTGLRLGGRKVHVAADEDVKVKGKKISLG